MNKIIENMVTRRSVKKYKSDPVPEDVLQRIVEAGTYAANGMGRQSAIIVAITNAEVRNKLSQMNATVMGREGIDPFYGAPTVLVVLADKSVPTHVYDGSLVLGNLMNAAHSEGVDSCWIHRAKEEFETPEGKDLLKQWGVEGDYEGIGHCILGYADGDPKPALPRKKNFVYFVN